MTDDDGRLLGCITDGDLRRLLAAGEALLDRPAGECMHPGPRTMGRDELASAALKLMEDHRITSAFVCDDDGRLEGVVHIHDLWRLELF